MNAGLRELLPIIETWSEEDQLALVEAAREIEAFRSGLCTMSSEEGAVVVEGLAEAERGEFASEERINALWKRVWL